MTESYSERLARVEAKTNEMLETLNRLNTKLEEMISHAHQARVDLQMTRNMLETAESLVIMPNDVEIGDHDARRRWWENVYPQTRKTEKDT